MNNVAKKYSSGSSYGNDGNENCLSSSTFDQISEKLLPPGRKHVESALNYLAALEDDWNGEGAIAPTEQAIEASHALNNNFMLDRKSPDKVSPDGDGAVLFIWNTKQFRLTLTIEASLIHISVEYNDGCVELPDSIPYDLTAIPRAALQYIPKVERRNA